MDKKCNITFISVDAAAKILYAGPQHPCYAIAHDYLQTRLSLDIGENGVCPTTKNKNILSRHIHRQIELLQFWDEQIKRIVAESMTKLQAVVPVEQHPVISFS